jgi:hypothetical protein
MTVGATFLIWRRRWVLTTALLAGALVLTATAGSWLPRTYQSAASVILLASRADSRPNGGNPYLSFSPSLTLTADAVSRELMAPGIVQALAADGFGDPYTVALAPYTTTTTGSVLLVTVTGSDPAAVQQTLHGVLGQISSSLLRLQGRVRAGNRIHALTLSASQQPSLSLSQSARPFVALIVVEFLLALGIPVLVDGRAARRRLRQAGPPRPSGHRETAAPLAYDPPTLAEHRGPLV